MFTKILIANRGEIACRIIKTAKKLGIKTAAVYSEIDAHALHVELADEAVCIGPAPALQSYLNREIILKAALATNAQAIHPGYGFLSEDAEFARLCEKAGIIFIGPSAASIEAMGDKSNAKLFMQKSAVPVTPGYQGDAQDLATLTQEAQKIGLPLLIKAASGGGGKGMRLVTDFAELETAIQSAKREAKASFGDDKILLEKYLSPTRHIEVQIFFDQKGNGVHLLTRDCSLQRRHQKIIEEAPAPHLPPALVDAMTQAALKAGSAIRYTGAGTIEFLVDEHENFYFMEMNTRLQVEHPVTEMITGLDLVEWQLRIAAGETLPLTQDEIQFNGHAIEARLCAENPDENFSPSSGPLAECDFPNETQIRIDTGVRKDDTISSFYDPMIAKIITFAPEREAAIHLLQQALAQTFILGVHTNTEFLYQLLKTSEVQTGKYHTKFVEQHKEALLEKSDSLPAPVIAAVLLAEIEKSKEKAATFAKVSEDTFSPWFERNHWRVTNQWNYAISFNFDNKPITIKAKIKDEGYVFNDEKAEYFISADWKSIHLLHLTINQQLLHLTVFYYQDDCYIFYAAKKYKIKLNESGIFSLDNANAEQHLKSSMPGTILEIHVKPGQAVKKGDKLMVLEAMKMEHTLTAAMEGIIKTIYFKVGDQLEEGAELLEFE